MTKNIKQQTSLAMHVAEFIGAFEKSAATAAQLKTERGTNKEIAERIRANIEGMSEESVRLELTKGVMLTYGLAITPNVGQRGATWPKAEVLAGECSDVCPDVLSAQRLIDRMKKARTALYSMVFDRPEKSAPEISPQVAEAIKRAVTMAQTAGLSKADFNRCIAELM